MYLYVCLFIYSSEGGEGLKQHVIMSASGAQPGSLVPPRSNSTYGVGGGFAPGVPGSDGGPHVNKCAYVDTNYDLIIAIICSLYIAFGILYSFFGKRN